MIKAIIFDLWETLGVKNIGISSTLQTYFDIKKTPEYSKRYCRSIQTQLWSSHEEMAKGFLNEFGIENIPTNRDFVINTIKTGIERATLFEGMKELLEKLHKNYKLGLISDTTNFEAVALEKWRIEKLFNVKIWSFETGFLKDVGNNFEIMSEKLGITSRECLFIDNNKNSVESAKKIGMQGIVFTSIEKLKQDLEKMSVTL